LATLTKSIKSKIQVILKLDIAFGLVWQCSPGLTIANFSILLIQGILPLLSLYMMKLIVDGVTIGLKMENTSQAIEQVILPVVLLGGITIIDAGIQALGRFYQRITITCSH